MKVSKTYATTTLILVADKALYKAKFKGRDQVVLGGHEKPH